MRKIKYKKGKKVQPSYFDYTGKHKQVVTEMQLFVYSDVDVSEYENIKQNELAQLINKNQINWLNIHGLNNTDIIKSIGYFFGIDNFMIRDILNTTKRTKIITKHFFLI